MKADELWRATDRRTLSFEVFPARDDKAIANLDKAIDKLAELRPEFFSVTFGAGGSTRHGSRRLVEQLKERTGADVVAYFAGYGLGPAQITDVLDQYKRLGVENILAVRGDPPQEQEGFHPHPQSFAHASDLLSFIHARYDFCLGAAGYPEGHKEAASPESDLSYLKLKVQNGASFLIANYFYDNEYYFKFVDKCRRSGIDVPIVPGIMPIVSVPMMHNLAKLCGATIPQQLRDGLSALPEGDKEAVAQFGIEFATKQCRDLLRRGTPGLHFYTMDRAKSSVAIVQSLRTEGLLPAPK